MAPRELCRALPPPDVGKDRATSFTERGALPTKRPDDAVDLRHKAAGCRHFQHPPYRGQAIESEGAVFSIPVCPVSPQELNPGPLGCKLGQS